MRINRILINGTGRWFIQQQPGDDVNTQYGRVSGTEIDRTADGKIVTTETGEQLVVFQPSWIDQYKKIRRGAQIITLKDAGVILATTGLGPESIVAEAGSGSGALTCFLARHCKHVYSYDTNAEHLAIAQHNSTELGLRNVSFRPHDIITGVPDGPIDCLILDIPEPWRALHLETLRVGAYIVTYTPSTVQLQQVQHAAAHAGLLPARTVEVTERHWTVRRDAVRPTSRNTAFTAFLSFFRYLGPAWPALRPQEPHGTPAWTLPEGMDAFF